MSNPTAFDILEQGLWHQADEIGQCWCNSTRDLDDADRDWSSKRYDRMKATVPTAVPA